MSSLETTEKEQQILAKIAQSIISTGVTLEFLEEIRYTPAYCKDLKRKGNLFLKELEKEQKKHFDKILYASEKDTDAIFNIQYDLIKLLAKMDLYTFDEIGQVIEAYSKEPKAIQGIVNQINKRSKS